MRSRLSFITLLVAGHTLLGGAASLGGDGAEPPLSPDGEMVMNDPDTSAYCLAQARGLGAKLDAAPETAGYFRWTLGEPLVTHNDHWGVVCRIDFTMASEDVSPRVNRLVLYSGERKMNVIIAIGEDVAPLNTVPSAAPFD